MRVISGTLRGRFIEGYDIVGTRPTMDRIKESLFAIIQDNIKDSVVLDLFAGSGSYGIETISRGAKHVYFNDFNKECVKVIKKNLVKLEITDKSTIYNLDYKMCLSHLKSKSLKFNLVFLDPPYKLIVINEILDYLEKNNLLINNAYVIVELYSDNLKEKYNNLIRIKEKYYNQKKIYIYKYKGEGNEIK